MASALEALHTQLWAVTLFGAPPKRSAKSPTEKGFFLLLHQDLLATADIAVRRDLLDLVRAEVVLLERVEVEPQRPLAQLPSILPEASTQLVPLAQLQLAFPPAAATAP